MEQPPAWRIDTTAEFDQDCREAGRRAPRVGQVLDAWYWFLERRPQRFSTGVSSKDDNTRVTSWKDEEHDGVEYFAGLTIDDKQRVVLLRWLDLRDLLSEESD
jgi:hypothetical protein